MVIKMTVVYFLLSRRCTTQEQQRWQQQTHSGPGDPSILPEKNMEMCRKLHSFRVI